MPRTALSRLLFALVLAAMPAVLAAKEEARAPIETVLTTVVDGTLVVTPEGAVGSHAFTSDVAPALKAMLDKSVAGWRFEMESADGSPLQQPVPLAMRLSLAATKAGKDYQVRIENLLFRPADAPAAKGEFRGPVIDLVARRMNPPAYPRDLVKMRVSGRVLLGMRFAPDGSVAEVVPVQSMLYDVRGSENQMAKAIQMFERASVEAARKWSASIQAKSAAGTTAKDYTITTAVEFLMTDRPLRRGEVPEAIPAGYWKRVNRTSRREMPWLSGLPGVQAVGVADVASSEVQPVDLAGVPALKTAVVGTVL